LCDAAQDRTLASDLHWLLDEALRSIPSIPPGTTWVEEHRFLFAHFTKTLDGVSKAAPTVAGAWWLFKRASRYTAARRHRLTRIEQTEMSHAKSTVLVSKPIASGVEK